ncbi:spore germination protein [Bacillus marinisedimentorum]|uniref:spore germination protein n=1 Tax=Bacillus marinisedimentorum TaxID=1821260 RepID=UPI000872FE2B|nr:spore germination protein [Bacillus marinisedimentorum]
MQQNENYPREDPITEIDDLSGTDYGLLSESMDENLSFIKESLGHTGDLIIRKIEIGLPEQPYVNVLYIKGLADAEKVSKFVIEPLASKPHIDHSGDSFEYIEEALTIGGNFEYVTKFGQLLSSLLSGNTVLMLNHLNKALCVTTINLPERAISEPKSQNVVRGPHEGFTESLITNKSLVRKRLKTPHLRSDMKVVGRYTKTKISIMYIDGIANEKIVEEVQNRIDKIDIDGIIESANIEELIQDSTFSPFPTIFNSERPDVVTSGLLEGRVAILVEGTPYVLLVPALFPQFLQAAEDYYQRSDFGLMRMLRFLAFFLALLSPSIFVAVKTFHQELLPTQLIINFAAQREGVPFPAFVEALLMELTFEILREAGVRMPRAVGQAISIVGALVIGQAAVEAGLVTPAMVIVVSITAIASFVFPAYNLAISIRALRFGFMFLAASFGLFGIAVGIFLLVLHLSGLRSFGVPYLTPLAPFNMTDQKDTVLHLPLKFLRTRPRLVSQENKTRLQVNEKTNKE